MVRDGVLRTLCSSERKSKEMLIEWGTVVLFGISLGPVLLGLLRKVPQS